MYTRVETGAGARWTEALSAGEEMLDVSADRVLYRTGNPAGVTDRCFIRARSGGQETEILAIGDRQLVTARLTPRGALLVVSPNTETDPSQLYEWRDGALLPVVSIAARNGASVDGAWAAWNTTTADQVRVRNLETGAEQTFSQARDPDVGSNGDVVFSRPGVGVVRVRGGVEEVVGPAGLYPETDGVNVVYAVCTAACTGAAFPDHSIRLYRPEGPLELWVTRNVMFPGNFSSC